MKRMQALCLLPSHTYFYKKLDEFGMDHDKEILKKVANEGMRKDRIYANKTSAFPIALGSQKTDHEVMPCNTDAAEGSKFNSGTAKKKMLDSLLQVQNDYLQENLPPSQKSPVRVFPSTTKESANNGNINCGLVEKGQCIYNILPCDTGRKLVIDNVDVHQLTHDMTEEHQNPDAHYCSLMSTENRVSGNHLSDARPICELMDMENGKCCPSKLEHNQQHENYVQLVSRVVAQELPCLDFLKDVTVPHIPHQYSSVMKQKTDTVSTDTYQ